MPEGRIKQIAYVTTYDSTIPGSWSGIGYRMAEHILAAGVALNRVGPLQRQWRPDLQVKSLLTRYFTGGQFLRSRHPAVLRGYAREIEQRLREFSPDLVLSPGTLPIALLDTDTPLVFWTDATFDALVDFYPAYSNLCPQSKREGHAMDQAALDRCALALYSSPWAAESAVADFNVDPEKIHVVPFGPSLNLAPGADEMEGIIAGRSAGLRSAMDFPLGTDFHPEPGPVKLLFMGVDWQRKGGDIAVAVTAALMRAGIQVELHIVGTALPGPMPGVRGHGFIPAGTMEGRVRLDTLLRQSTFLLLPTRADCVPVVLAEACSFGLPILTTAVGGVPGLFTDGLEGRLFPVGAPPEAYVEAVRSLLDEPEAYAAMCRRARAAYEEQLNWPHAARKALSCMEKVVS
ncbi:MAG: glycosyltransferase family 4 protein [Anaerolineales bacterium]|nr:glycosyltransferase family 4 protein [Anaerolineales bacterium]